MTLSTREKLLNAAREQFTSNGYNATTLRSIAAQAEVDVAMIAHYFGNKRGLYQVVTSLAFDPQQILDQLDGVPIDQLGHAIAETFISQWDKPEGKAVLARFRSLLDEKPEELFPTINGFLWQHIRKIITNAKIDNPDIRIELIMSTLFGTAAFRKFLNAPELSKIAYEDLTTIIGNTLQYYLTLPLK